MIEDDWQTGRIGDFWFDALAGNISGMLEFSKGLPRVALILGRNSGGVVESRDQSGFHVAIRATESTGF